MRTVSIILIYCLSYCMYAQETKSVLFIGNSYTYYNDLPGLLAQAANSAGDVVLHESNTPPNVTWQDHVNDLQTTAKIMQGNWDYISLQEAGRNAGRSDQYVLENMYPYANELNDLVEEFNPCGETLFYMGWGERDGVPSECPIWPPFCTYEEMDDLIRLRHLIMGENYEAEVSPVGAVWRYLRDNHPGIDLYDPDGYHPSLAGSYAGAITFYTSIFRKDPNLVSFDSTLTPTAANTIRNAVRLVVYENLSTWFIGDRDPISDFNITNNGNLEYAFTNTSSFSSSFLWTFGDGASSTDENPIHTYATAGTYDVTLNANYFCSNSSINTQTLNATLGVGENSLNEPISIYPNPSNGILYISLPNAISSEVSLEVFSVSGQKVHNTKMYTLQNENSIDLKHLKSGCYFLKISDGSSFKQVLKFIRK